MTARVGDDMPQTQEALAARVRELEELLAAARESVAAEQRDHALVCPGSQRPAVRRIGDLPTGGVL